MFLQTEVEVVPSVLTHQGFHILTNHRILNLHRSYKITQSNTLNLQRLCSLSKIIQQISGGKKEGLKATHLAPRSLSLPIFAHFPSKVNTPGFMKITTVYALWSYTLSPFFLNICFRIEFVSNTSIKIDIPHFMQSLLLKFRIVFFHK